MRPDAAQSLPRPSRARPHQQGEEPSVPCADPVLPPVSTPPGRMAPSARGFWARLLSVEKARDRNWLCKHAWRAPPAASRPGPSPASGSQSGALDHADRRGAPGLETPREERPVGAVGKGCSVSLRVLWVLGGFRELSPCWQHPSAPTRCMDPSRHPFSSSHPDPAECGLGGLRPVPGDPVVLRTCSQDPRWGLGRWVQSSGPGADAV